LREKEQSPKIPEYCLQKAPKITLGYENDEEAVIFKLKPRHFSRATVL
jgi:hypothetical protein